MDPASLLDPRGAQQRAAQQRGNHPTPQFQQFDARALLNPKSVSKRPATEQGTEPERGREDPTGPGQISLVERLHHVQERTASPAKRARTEDERKKTAKLHANSGNFGGGAMNFNQNNTQQSLPTQGPAIDLTMSDDESDVQVVKDNSEQVICIGKVKNVYVQAHQVPYQDPKKYQGNHGSLSRIATRFRRSSGQQNTNIIMVVDPTGREFGRVDLISAKALAPLMDGSHSSGLKWMSWTDPRRKSKDELAGAGPGGPANCLISITLQLYCPRKHAHGIGRYLEKQNVQLQDPILDLRRYDYFNPQTHNSFAVTDVAHSNFESQGGYAPAAGGNYVLRSVDEIRSDVQTMFDTMVESDNLPTREPSPMIQTQLYKHQKQALYFLWDNEQDWQGEEGDNRKDSLWQPKYRSNGKKYYLHVITGEEVNNKPPGCRGGILADEMGLGKTLSILSLVADLESMTVAAAFSQKAPPPRCSGGMVQPTINSRATLLICPLSTMYNWKSQLETHFPGGQGLKWINYHGKNRNTIGATALADNDLVITTYQMIQADANDRSTPLPHIHWFRIVLDEAHTIRNAATKQSLAACSLPAQRRWAVTGTPVQNRLDDLGALFRFLHLHPFANTAGFNHHILTPFKNADPEVIPKLQLLVSSVTLRRIKERVLDIEIPKRHDSIVRLEFSKDEQTLHDWFEADSQRKVNAVTSGEKLGGKSYARILTAITNLRLICAHGRDLLSEEALKLTDGMTYDNPMSIDDDDVDPNSAPELNHVQAYDMLELMVNTDNDRCSYCKELLSAIIDSDEDEDEGDTMGYMTPCYQVVCAKHGKKLQDELSKSQPRVDGLCICLFCDTLIKPALFALSKSGFTSYMEERARMKRDPKLAKKIGGYTGPSTKTRALLGDLAAHRDWSLANPSEPPIKSVIFSTWTTHLDLIEIALSHHGHKLVRLDGRMPREARNRSLTSFDKDDSVTVILVSIGAGGLGLNLTKANKAYVMEPQFNPAAEAQAVDRVHRLGQTREVEIKRFIMKDSFEEKMLELQRKKKELADITMARDKTTKEQAARQKLEDLRSLFR
ncbi:DNA repair protein rad5 [Lentithecium fluviatile CBS 122367]|uniref:DNA repair protein rad5 n=1 Tax=Lentithecium fluviatile CBS 122367 TaxID=1168545 RepID=A0A6G1J1Q4_9PLEO|nr:DNA repair protein rad5 [Lentithecium fluviatile CBS 122367]